MIVTREIQMDYDGKSYTITPSNKLLRGIEREVSLLGMINRTAAGNPPVSELAFVLAEFLKSAGADVDEDSMRNELMFDLENNNGEMFSHLCEELVKALSPVEAAGKKPKAAKASRKT